VAELFLLSLHITFFFPLLIVFITFSSLAYSTFSGSQHTRISRPLALASPYPSDFVTFISIRYQELYWLLVYTKTIQNDEKHAEKIKPFRSRTQSLERAAALLFVLQQTNEQHTLL